jgi:hypothetical protein
MERLSFNRSIDTQRISVTGAAAHMSLHQNRQCQRADAFPPPFVSGVPGYRLRRRKRVGQNPAPLVNGHIWRSFSTVNSRFRNFVGFLASIAGDLIAMGPLAETHMMKACCIVKVLKGNNFRRA